MESNELLEKIQQDLPLLDTEILEMWLLPFAQKVGWPPNSSSYWSNRLYSLPISAFASAHWEKKEVDFSKIAFTKAAQEQIDSLYAVYVKDMKDPFFYPILVGPSGDKTRFFRVVKYILKNGVFPKPPILMQRDSGLYEIVDGNHRITALIQVQKIFGIFLRLDEEQKNKFFDDNDIKHFPDPSQKQYAWVCTLQ